jgi:hypothetical protein
MLLYKLQSSLEKKITKTLDACVVLFPEIG